MRQLRLTGIYYPAAPTLISKQLEEAFLSERGPGDLPAKISKNSSDSSKENVKGIIVPMYKYELCAPCAAWAYKALAESETPDIILVIGQSDTEPGITLESYETPYGIARVDQPFARKLIEKGHIKENNSLFDNNDAFESQLPFIQFIFKNQLEKIKFLPILVTEDVKLKELAVDIKDIAMDTGKKIAVVVPVNFTSYGSNFGYIPFSINQHKKVYELDAGAIDLIKENKPLDFLKYVDTQAMNTKNYLGIVLALLLLKPKNVSLEQYYTSADINKDYQNFVSFAAIVLK